MQGKNWVIENFRIFVVVNVLANFQDRFYKAIL